MNLGTNIPTAAQTRAPLEMQPTGGLIPELWLVDDNREIRRLLADFIHRAGTVRCTRQFSSAESLLEALERETPPDAILLDVQMKQMSGVDAIRPIRSLARSTHVFIMTTFYDGDLAARALNAGASGFFLKRQDVERIIESIRKVSAEPVPKVHSGALTRLMGRAEKWLSTLGLKPGYEAGRARGGKGMQGAGGTRPLPWLSRAVGVLRTFL